MAVAGSNVITLSGASLSASASFSLSVNVTGTAGGTQNNTTSAVTGLFDDGSGLFRVATGGTASASVGVVAPPVLAAAFNPATIPPNGTTALTFTITNPAANTVAETGVAFSDTLPAGLVVATPNGLSPANPGGGTVTATAGSNSISLSGASIAVGSSITFSVNVTAALGRYTDTTGAVTSTNGGTGNTASATLVVAPPTLVGTFRNGMWFLDQAALGQPGGTILG
jgi:hypothetical protein